MMRLWSSKTRSAEIEAARSREFDMVIIGGGITGAGIARECSLRGLSFCLLDKNDFSFGTSSRSSKMFHGGMRYLASREFGLVRESTGERNWLRTDLPNLVRPLGFIYPAYKRGKAKPLMVWLAVKLYDMMSDWFSEYKNYRKSRILWAKVVKELEPTIAMEEPDLGRMVLAGLYYDTNCDDARVTLETIKESLDYSGGNSVALNYTRAGDFLKDSTGKVRGVVATDAFSGDRFRVMGKCVVSATGIWTDETLAAADYAEQRIYPTKGVHLVVPNERLGNRNAFSLISFDDGRFFFVIKRGKVSIIGTTDTVYDPNLKNLNEPRCNKDDCEYLLRTVNRMFPHAMLTYADIISTFAGIRPLIKQEGAVRESDLSRKHEIFQTKDGVVAIAGGKSTIFRLMAEDLLFYLVEHKYLDYFSKPEYNKRSISRQPFKIGLNRSTFDQIISDEGLPGVADPDQVDYFYTQYGRGGIEILREIRKNPESGNRYLEGYPHCTAEILYILEHENAPKLTDILCRRTEAQWMIWHYKQSELASAVAEIMASYYNWSETEKELEIEEYLDYVESNVRFLKE